MKKILLGLGAISVVGIPVLITVSCGTSNLTTKQMNTEISSLLSKANPKEELQTKLPANSNKQYGPMNTNGD